MKIEPRTVICCFDRRRGDELRFRLYNQGTLRRTPWHLATDRNSIVIPIPDGFEDDGKVFLHIERRWSVRDGSMRSIGPGQAPELRDGELVIAHCLKHTYHVVTTVKQ